MGLLDDAIREHLELKRRRGADPGEVAREEREALAVQAQASEHAAAADPSLAVAEPLPSEEIAEAAERKPMGTAPPPASTAPPAAAAGPVRAPQPAARAQEQAHEVGETAELDMSTVLEDELEEPAGPAPAGPLAPRTEEAAAGPLPEQESLEWEVPGEPAEQLAAGQTYADPAAEHDEAHDPSAEDVLEETPDFLRETPEHERLWFEQRPPRDFDFDK